MKTRNFGLVGLLHDLDYELVGRDMNRHGLILARVLEGELPGIALSTIRAHNELTEFKDN